MVIYEVTVTLEDSSSATELATYMVEKHIPEIMETPCFLSARFEELVDEETIRFRTQYVAKSEEEIELYFSKYAHGFREDFKQHFPSGMTVTREIWSVIKEWQKRTNV